MVSGGVVCVMVICAGHCVLLFCDSGLENKLITYGSKNGVLLAANGSVKGHTKRV